MAKKEYDEKVDQFFEDIGEAGGALAGLPYASAEYAWDRLGGKSNDEARTKFDRTISTTSDFGKSTGRKHGPTIISGALAWLGLSV